MIKKKYFRRKIWRKNWRFYVQNNASGLQSLNPYIENWRKLAKL
jgi:hypothetical protein